MIRYSYHLKNYRSWLKGFSNLLGIPITERKLQITPEIGSGYLFASNISSDISYVIMNFSLNDDLVFFRKKSSNYGLILLFNQAEVSDRYTLTTQQETVFGKTQKTDTIFLSSTNYDLEFFYSKHSKLNAVSVLFSAAFVKRWIKKDILLDLMFYTGQRLKNVNKVPITFEYRQLLKEIFETDTQSPISHLVLQNRILLLTEKFLNTFLSKSSQQGSAKKRTTRKEKEEDIKALKDVERILSNHQLEKFPSIEALSVAAKMSTTKLKIKFKEVYGMKLYQFYNRNRLEKAKEMLQSGKYSVKEAGYHIGFTNLSNFAKAFKKEFGFLPNEMLKNK
ncbi:MAG: helix-turn-helix transcriptional regulator [Bacteroidetes bacterium]|nr:helix-turn-helix transcriptional regulator [Bacteroidota bacterium]